MKNLLILVFILVFTKMNAQTFPFTLDGPDAPMVSIGVSNQNFVLYLDNPPSSNNYMEMYWENNPNVPGPMPDSSFRFQGYLVYQVEPVLLGQALTSGTTIMEEMLNDPSIARLVGQSDLQDTITTVTSHIFDSTTMQCNNYIPFPSASNSGTQYTYTITTDAFTSQPFQPGNTYCFWTLSYSIHGYNYDLGCDPLTRPLMYSRKSPIGAIIMHCVDLNGNGVTENELNEIDVIQNEMEIIISQKSNDKELYFSIYNAEGKLIDKTQLNTEITRVQKDNYSSGIYIYSITDNEKTKTGKLVVIH